MQFSFREAEKKDNEEWNKLALKSKLGQPWHLWEVGDLIASDRGWKMRRFVCECDGQLIGIFPFLITPLSRLALIYRYLKKPYQPVTLFNQLLAPFHANSHPMGSYGGPVISQSYEIHEDILKGFIQYIEQVFTKEKILSREILLSPITSNDKTIVQSFIANGYKYKTIDYYVLNLSNPLDQIWRELDKKCRNEIGQGEKRGAEILEVFDKDGVEECYQLYLLTMQRQGKSAPISRDLFSKLSMYLLKENLVCIYIAKYEDIPIGSLSIIALPSYALYWITGFDHNYAWLRSQNILIWNAIKKLKEKGVSYLDFGAASPVPGIRHWKQSWATDLLKTWYLYKKGF